MFSRRRILAGGQILEAIGRLKRFTTYLASSVLQFAGRMIMVKSFQIFAVVIYINIGCVDARFIKGIPSSQSMALLCKPRSGMIGQRKYLPIRNVHQKCSKNTLQNTFLKCISNTF